MNKVEQDLQKEILLETVLCLNYGWKQHTNYSYANTCTICLENMKGKYVLETNCNHCYCVECIMFSLTDFKWLKCPSCSVVYKHKNQLYAKEIPKPEKIEKVEKIEKIEKNEKMENLKQFDDDYSKMTDSQLWNYLDEYGPNEAYSYYG